ncbi:M20 family metallopeptidase [Ensifer adhaerens]|jgi:acetylornithine deacetylase/succinyl-diaminopimelate desuccinylase family protein|uniref:M20 family metallopeptidase n=1 Tax=Ensifer adhaerens TaxID=106592 RepID=UPI00202F847B|nr:ArgE/DapE family deacylase [Ensifer adhaerens]
MSHAETIKIVQDALEADRDWLIQLTQDIVRIPSVNPKFTQDPEINREPDVQSHLERKLQEIGFETEQWEVQPGRPNLVGDLPGNEDRSLILNGHIDVVPIGDEAGWSVEPFGGAIKDGRLYGRGAIDMKSGVAACIAAARAIRKCGVELEGRLSIHSVVDEEAGGFGSIDAVKRGKLAKAVLVAEPTWGDVLPVEGGLEWVRVTIRGSTAHASWRYNEIFPQQLTSDRLAPGVNAIELASKFIQALQSYERDRTRARTHPLMPAGANTINIGAIRGGAGLGADGLPVTLTNPAIVPDVVVIDLNMMFLPQETSAEVRRDFEAFVHHFAQTDAWMRQHPPHVKWELGELHFPPLNTSPEHPLVASVARHKAIVGKPAQVKGFVAVCDAAHYAGAGVDGVIFGANGGGFHGVDEYVEIESMIETSKVIAASVIDWCGIRG